MMFPADAVTVSVFQMLDFEMVSYICKILFCSVEVGIVVIDQRSLILSGEIDFFKMSTCSFEISTSLPEF